MNPKISKSRYVAIVAGEASGDLHGAHVIEALRRRYTHLTVAGAGGSAMQKAGAEIVVHSKALSVMGITAVLVKAPQIIKLIMRLKRFLSKTSPDLLILIDFPDFNLHLAGYAKKLGIPVLYYISPQVWAWRSKRIHKIKRRVNHMAVILPFEKQIYDQHKVPVTYVGHPLLDDAAKHRSQQDSRPDPCHPTIALLPGSRKEEIRRLLPEMLQAAQMLQKKIEAASFIVSCAPSIEPGLYTEIASAFPLANIEFSAHPVRRIYASCTIAIVASGTASLEAAIYGVPSLIVYKVSDFNYWLCNKLVGVPYIGLANLIAQQIIFPELIQSEACAARMADTADKMLSDTSLYQKMLDNIKEVQQRLGEPGASERVADIAYRLMEGRGDF